MSSVLDASTLLFGVFTPTGGNAAASDLISSFSGGGSDDEAAGAATALEKGGTPAAIVLEIGCIAVGGPPAGGPSGLGGAFKSDDGLTGAGRLLLRGGAGFWGCFIVGGAAVGLATAAFF